LKKISRTFSKPAFLRAATIENVVYCEDFLDGTHRMERMQRGSIL
jgi:hypothetical protein